MSRTGSGHRESGVPESAFSALYYGSDPKYRAKVKHRELSKFAPQLYQIIYGRKYLLPDYRQGDYYPQNFGNILYAGTLLDPLLIGLQDDVANAAYCNAIQAISCRRPQLWLEKELAELFMRSKLPLDMETGDVKWRWPGMRIHVPKGILRIANPKEGAGEHDLLYIDICRVPLETALSIPEPYAAEIVALATEYGWDNPHSVTTTLSTVYAQTALMITGNLSGRDPETLAYAEAEKGDFMIYGVIKPFDEISLGQIAHVTGKGEHLNTPFKATENDDRFCEKILHLGLNCLLYLGSTPLIYEPETIIRKARMEGKHAVPALLRARFVGRSQLRAKSAHIAGPVHHTGRQLPAHWVCGHWKRQPFGHKSAERKLIWIQPYQTYGLSPEEEK